MYDIKRWFPAQAAFKCKSRNKIVKHEQQLKRAKRTDCLNQNTINLRLLVFRSSHKKTDF